MKLYSANMAPSPRRSRMALAEKGISDVEVINIDLAGGENLKPEFRNLNRMAKVPVLELDDGTCISEGSAIYRYLEEIQPEPNLLGRTALEKATIEMWDRRLENALFMPIGQCFQHTSGFFKDRMTPIVAWGEEAGKLAGKFLPILEQQLQKHEFVAGDHFSVADITALCSLEFGKVIQLRITDEFPAIQRWHAQMKARPSYTA